MNRLTDVFGDSAVVAEDVRKTAYELEDKHNIASYPLLEAADHIESLYAEAVKMQAEIDALKAQNAELLAELLAALTESLAYVEATLSNHDAGCQRHPSTEHARDCILSDLDQIKAAIAKARGDL